MLNMAAVAFSKRKWVKKEKPAIESNIKIILRALATCIDCHQNNEQTATSHSAH